jgi:hypothetical protein
MERVTRKIFDYIAEMKRTGKNGTQKYVIKQGINKGKTL